MNKFIFSSFNNLIIAKGYDDLLTRLMDCVVNKKAAKAPEIIMEIEKLILYEDVSGEEQELINKGKDLVDQDEKEKQGIDFFFWIKTDSNS